MTYENHILTLLASVLCCGGVLWLVWVPVARARRIYESATFLPTYAVGILAWLMHGIEIASIPLVLTCALQLGGLCVLLRRALACRLGRNVP